MTYSIVALDRDSGELGVAVQSRAFSVGATVPWALPGVGAVATQSYADRSYGPLGLELLRAGKSPEEALAALLAADEGAASRQVGIVDAEGRVAVHTGEHCILETGHVTGDAFSVQANMMRSRDVWPAMAETFSAKEGTLARRLLAALESAEEAGGDFRGRQSAALLVAAQEPAGRPWDARIELRVEDHHDPVGELRRLLGRQEAYESFYQLQGEPTPEVLDAAREAGLAEDEVEWLTAGAVWRGGDAKGARRWLDRLVARDARWAAAWAMLSSRPPPDGS